MISGRAVFPLLLWTSSSSCSKSRGLIPSKATFLCESLFLSASCKTSSVCKILWRDREEWISCSMICSLGCEPQLVPLLITFKHLRMVLSWSRISAKDSWEETSIVIRRTFHSQTYLVCQTPLNSIQWAFHEIHQTKNHLLCLAYKKKKIKNNSGPRNEVCIWCSCFCSCIFHGIFIVKNLGPFVV